jgi:DNA-binding response OmpR family regulator
LIIDDDPDTVASTRIVLEAHQFKVDSAADTKEGLGKIQKAPPALIILDVMMEGKAAGIIFARELRRRAETAKVPILMLTGMTEQTGFSLPGKDQGTKWLPVDDYVEKPVDPEILIKKVKTLLEKNA